MEGPLISGPWSLARDPPLFPSPDSFYNPGSMLSKDLLAMLVCPVCKMELEYRESPESLRCKQCHRVYQVRDGLPIMLIDEAKIEA